MPNFMDALNTKVSDVERPPLMPVGTYRWMVEKLPAIDTIGDGKWDVVDFPLKCIGAEEDVDADALSEFGNINNVRMRHRFMFNKEDEAEFKRTEYNLKRFCLDTLRVDADEGATFKELLNGSVNCQLMATVRWRTDKRDGETQYAEIGKTAPLE